MQAQSSGCPSARQPYSQRPWGQGPGRLLDVGRVSLAVEHSHMLDGRLLVLLRLLGSLLRVRFPYQQGDTSRVVSVRSSCERGGQRVCSVTDSLGSAGLIIRLTAPNARVFLALDPPLPPFLLLAMIRNETSVKGVVGGGVCFESRVVVCGWVWVCRLVAGVGELAVEIHRADPDWRAAEHAPPRPLPRTESNPHLLPRSSPSHIQSNHSLSINPTQVSRLLPRDMGPRWVGPVPCEGRDAMGELNPRRPTSSVQPS